MEELPDPLTPPGSSVSTFDSFLFNTDRLLGSELLAISTGDEFKAAVCLWCRAWKQSPAASLPNDERILASFSGNPSKWKRIREVALRGFILCSDGRLYHKVLAEDALNLIHKKHNYKDRASNAAKKRWGK